MPRVTKLMPHEAAILADAEYFTAIRKQPQVMAGRNPYIRREFADQAAAMVYAKGIGDGRTMIYAVSSEGRSAHLMNI